MTIAIRAITTQQNINHMTPQEKRTTIAKACGWKAVREEDGWWNVAPNGKRHIALHGSTHGLPDYLNDLNAIAEAVATLDHAQYQQYLRHLVSITAANAYSHSSVAWNRMICEATAAQRADAFINLINQSTT